MSTKKETGKQTTVYLDHVSLQKNNYPKSQNKPIQDPHPLL